MARKIAYIVSRYPKMSETIILHEVLDLQRRGLSVEVFSLIKQKESRVHTEADPLIRHTHYSRLLCFAVA